MSPAQIARLVHRAQAGDRAAFGELVDHFSLRLYRYAMVLGRDAQDAEDSCQETFIAGWEKISQLRDPRQFYHWLCGILRNEFKALWRRKKRTPHPTEVEECVEEEEMADREAIDSEREMELRIFQEFEEAGYAETARKVDWLRKFWKPPAYKLLFAELVGRSDHGDQLIEFAKGFLTRVHGRFHKWLQEQPPDSVEDQRAAGRTFAKVKLRKGKLAGSEFLANDLAHDEEIAVAASNYVEQNRTCLLKALSDFVSIQSAPTLLFPDDSKDCAYSLLSAFIEERVRQPIEKAWYDYITWIDRDSLEFSRDEDEEREWVLARMSEESAKDEEKAGSPEFVIDGEIWTAAVNSVNDKNHRCQERRGRQRFTGRRFFVAVVRRYLRSGGRVSRVVN